MARKFSDPPTGSPDEDGMLAYVRVTATTADREAAVEWAATDGAGDVLCVYDPDEQIIRRDEIKLQHLVVQLPASDRVPERVNVADLVRNGAEAWWVFDTQMAVELPRTKEKWARRDVERFEASKREAREQRGPLWWRALCWTGIRLEALGKKLTPNDRGFVGWAEGPGRGEWRQAQIRRA